MWERPAIPALGKLRQEDWGQGKKGYKVKKKKRKEEEKDEEVAVVRHKKRKTKTIGISFNRIKCLQPQLLAKEGPLEPSNWDKMVTQWDSISKIKREEGHKEERKDKQGKTRTSSQEASQLWEPMSHSHLCCSSRPPWKCKEHTTPQWAETHKHAHQGKANQHNHSTAPPGQRTKRRSPHPHPHSGHKRWTRLCPS